MDKGEYDFHTRYGFRNWWHRGNRELVLELLGPEIRGKKVLDVGFGAGHYLYELDRRGAVVEGIELSPYVAASVRETYPHINISVADIRDFSPQEADYDVILLLDMLTTNGLDPLQCLTRARELLRPGGKLVVRVPALQFLFGNHDKFVNQGFRFSRKQLLKLMKDSGFQVMKYSYINFFLFPLAALQILVANKSTEQKTLNKNLPRLLNGILYRIIAFEGFLIRSGIYLPIGTTFICISKK